jgi:hypothetical protein
VRRLTIELVFILPCLAQTQLSFNGVISGSLAGDDGSAILGGQVSLLLLTPPQWKRGTPQTLWSAASGTGGAFQVSGLSVGTYKICAQVPDSVWLNPCEWGLKPAQVTLSAGQPNATVKIVLSKGATVRIRVDDASHLLSQQEGKRPGAHLLLGVATDAFSFRLAPIVSQDAGGRDYQIVIPFGITAKVVARSSFFRLSDSTGVPLSSGTVIPVTVPAGQTPPTVRVVVSGGGQ